MTAYSKLTLKVLEGRSRLFALWVVLTYTKQFIQKYRARLSKKNEKEKVGVFGAKLKFTQTLGGKVSFNFFTTIQYYLPILIFLHENYLYRKYGNKFLKIYPASIRLLQLFGGVFCTLPLLEMFLPQDWANPTRTQQREEKKHNLLFKMPLYLWAIVEMINTVQVLAAVRRPSTSLKEKLSLILWLGFFNGAIGINVSHELIHKNIAFDKFLGNMLLMNVNYMHWGEEHLEGHHKLVATREDPATARFNEPFYRFFPRTLVGTVRSSWGIEMVRLKKLGLQPFSLQNRMIWYLALPMLYSAILAKVLKSGPLVIAAFYAQGFFSASMLEVVNYMEHYGLERKKIDGKYEPVDPTHSWNAAHSLSNAVTFKLQRHSDHHTYATRPYQLLRNFEESPQLPTGYPGMYLLVLCPPAFFWVMNPLVKAHNENKEAVLKAMEKEGVTQVEFTKSDKLKEAERVAKAKVALFLSTCGALFMYSVKVKL